MTDNSQATDEDILRMATEALNAASRIRAETAKNSGEAVAWLHEINEPTHGPAYLLSKSKDNPWSHWLETYKETCVYKCTPLYATPANSRAKNSGEAVKTEAREAGIRACIATVEATIAPGSLVRNDAGKQALSLANAMRALLKGREA